MSHARAWVLALASGVAACSHAQAGPAAVAASFADAIERGDTRAAYALMSSAYRQKNGYEAFAAAIAAGGPEARAAARRLRDGARGGVVRAEVELDLGERLSLVEDAGTFKVDGPAYDPYRQTSPRDALRSFIRALEDRRWDVVIRLAPRRRRTGLDAEKMRAFWEGSQKQENAILLEALRAAVANPIVDLGEEAAMPYGQSGQEVRFVREDGQWCIEDVD